MSTRSGAAPAPVAIPAAAVSAVSTSCPAARSSLVASARFAGVSSTSRIVAIRRSTCGAAIVLREHAQQPLPARTGLLRWPSATIGHVAGVDDRDDDHRDRRWSTGSLFSSRRMSRPSRPGIRRSSRIAAGCRRRASLTAATRIGRADDAVPVAGEHLLQQRRDRRVVVHAEQHALAVAALDRLGRADRRPAADAAVERQA